MLAICRKEISGSEPSGEGVPLSFRIGCDCSQCHSGCNQHWLGLVVWFKASNHNLQHKRKVVPLPGHRTCSKDSADFNKELRHLVKIRTISIRARTCSKDSDTFNTQLGHLVKDRTISIRTRACSKDSGNLNKKSNL